MSKEPPLRKIEVYSLRVLLTFKTMTKEYFIGEWVGTQKLAIVPFEVTIAFADLENFSMNVGHIEAKGNWRYEEIEKF